MSLKDTDVRTPGEAAIAKKFKLSLAKVRQLVDVGAKHEKEHNTNLAKAKEVARDHIGERPDYYKMLKKAERTDKNHMKEESATSAVRGLGFVTGDPGVNPVSQYINTNAMAYQDENGNKLDYIKKQHTNLHNSNLGYKAFDPTQIGANKNFIKEAKLNELGDYVKDGMPGYEGTTGPIRAVRKRDVKEQSPANPSYKERPLYERGKVPADMTDATARGVYEMDTSRMPMSKNIEDIRSTTGKDWKSRVMTASTYVSGAIGAVKNAVNGPPKPDMTRLSPKDSLPAERPAWSPDGGTSTPQVKYSDKRGYEPKFTPSQITSLTPSSKDAESSKTRGNALDMSPKYQGKTPSSTSGSTTQAATMERPGSQTKESDYYTPPGGSLFAKNMKEERIKEASVGKLQDYTTAAAERLASGSDAGERQKEVNRITGINTAVRKLHPEIYPGEVKVPAPINEISATKVGKVHLRYLEQNKFPPDYVRNAVKRKWLESDVGKTPEEKEKEQRKKEVKEDANRPDRDLEARTYTGATGTTHTTHEETKMDTKEHINEALDCILEDNLTEMKDNLMIALQEKAIEKLEERKKEIAANYFAQ